MTTNPTARLRALEIVYRASDVCKTCLGRPSRLVYIDPETDAVWHESMPAAGCPECGAPIFREYHLIEEAHP